MNMLCPIILFIGMSNVIGIQYLLPTKQQAKFTASVTIGAIINFIINLLLIPKYGAVGASIGTIAAELCVTSYQLLSTRKELDYKRIFKPIFKYIFASIIMFLVIFKISLNSNFLTIILKKFV